MTGDVKGAIVHDASCLIDLSKGKLLRFVPKLPFRLIVPFPIRHSEVLDFTNREWRLLDEICRWRIGRCGWARVGKVGG